MKTVSDKVVRHSLAYLPVQKWLVGTSPSTWKFGGYCWPTPLQNADFQSIFARSASAVTPSKKFQFTLIGSDLRAFQDEHRTLPLISPKGAQNRKTAVFHVKSYFAWRKSATKWADDSKSKCVVTYANLLTSVRRLAVARWPCDSSYLIFALSASAVTASEKN